MFGCIFYCLHWHWKRIIVSDLAKDCLYQQCEKKQGLRKFVMSLRLKGQETETLRKLFTNNEA